MIFKIPGRAYQAFSRILRLPGTFSFKGIQDEIVPTQDLSRMLQAQKVHHYLYSNLNTPAADADIDFAWNDLSDWDAVTKDGIAVASDAGLPALTDDRIIIAVSIRVAGTQSHYTTAELQRTVGLTFFLMASFGAIVTGHACASPGAPWTLPQWLSPNENALRLHEEVSGNAAAITLQIFMISAEPGVMARYSGV